MLYTYIEGVVRTLHGVHCFYLSLCPSQHQAQSLVLPCGPLEHRQHPYFSTFILWPSPGELFHLDESAFANGSSRRDVLHLNGLRPSLHQPTNAQGLSQ